MMMVMMVLLLLLLAAALPVFWWRHCGTTVVVVDIVVVRRSLGAVPQYTRHVFRGIATIIVGDELPRSIAATWRNDGFLYCCCRLRGRLAIRRHRQSDVNGLATIVRNYYRFAY
uniref:Putative secreted protein n=1 Tax=Anopheles darlingi TaxID=43151 RepID=A0A2M4D1J3_ANODA